MAIQRMKVGPGRLTLLDNSVTPAAATEFSHQLTTAVVSWDDDTGDPIDVLCGETEAGDVSWSATLSGTLYQDADVLVPWTWQHKGETFDAQFVPSDASGKQVTGRLTVKPLDFGGDVKTSPTSDFEWAFVGEPQISALPAGYVPVHATA